MMTEEPLEQVRKERAKNTEKRTQLFHSVALRLVYVNLACPYVRYLKKELDRDASVSGS